GTSPRLREDEFWVCTGAHMGCFPTCTGLPAPGRFPGVDAHTSPEVHEVLEFSREQVVVALAAEVGVLGAVLGRLTEREVSAPTRCEPWDVAALAVHTVGAVVRVVDALNERVPEGGGPVVSAVAYYSPDVRFSVEVDAER